MMIRPENYISEYEEKSYEELLDVRDKLMAEICSYEKLIKNNPAMFNNWEIDPSPNVVYQCNLQYLSALVLLTAEKYRCR